MKTLKKVTLLVAIIGAIVVNLTLLPIETKGLPEKDAHCAMAPSFICILGGGVTLEDWANKP